MPNSNSVASGARTPWEAVKDQCNAIGKPTKEGAGAYAANLSKYVCMRTEQKDIITDVVHTAMMDSLQNTTKIHGVDFHYAKPVYDVNDKAKLLGKVSSWNMPEHQSTPRVNSGLKAVASTAVKANEYSRALLSNIIFRPAIQALLMLSNTPLNKLPIVGDVLKAVFLSLAVSVHYIGKLATNKYVSALVTIGLIALAIYFGGPVVAAFFAAKAAGGAAVVGTGHALASSSAILVYKIAAGVIGSALLLGPASIRNNFTKPVIGGLIVGTLGLIAQLLEKAGRETKKLFRGNTNAVQYLLQKDLIQDARSMEPGKKARIIKQLKQQVLNQLDTSTRTSSKITESILRYLFKAYDANNKNKVTRGIATVTNAVKGQFKIDTVDFDNFIKDPDAPNMFTSCLPVGRNDSGSDSDDTSSVGSSPRGVGFQSAFDTADLQNLRAREGAGAGGAGAAAGSDQHVNPFATTSHATPSRNLQAGKFALKPAAALAAQRAAQGFSEIASPRTDGVDAGATQTGLGVVSLTGGDGSTQ